jgi:hypothetical protein
MTKSDPKFKADLSDCLSTTKLGKRRTESQPETKFTMNESVAQLKPLPPVTPETRDCKKPTVLHPKWEEKRKLFHLRQKTLLRIYVSKWWYEGLEWEERELLLLLVQSCKVDASFLDQIVYEAENTITGRRTVYLGGHSSNTMENPEWKETCPPIRAICLVGQVCYARIHEDLGVEAKFERKHYEIGQDLIDLIYDPKDYTAIWKLRSFQSLRDTIFQPFQMRELGKKGIKRPRIRGYTDGRGSAGDPKRTKLARQLDVVFWSELYESKWRNLHEEIEAMAGYFLDGDGVLKLQC